MNAMHKQIRIKTTVIKNKNGKISFIFLVFCKLLWIRYAFIAEETAQSSRTRGNIKWPSRIIFLLVFVARFSDLLSHCFRHPVINRHSPC